MLSFVKHSLTVSVLSGLLINSALAAPSEAPDAFMKRVADGLIVSLKTNQAKLQSSPTAVNALVRQNLDPYIDSQAFTRIVMGTYATNQYSTAAQRALFERNFRETLIENYGSAFAKYTNQTYSLRPYKDTGSKNPVAFQLTDKGSQWKIRNINVSGIDLGLQFRNQFAATVKRNGGSVDKAIATFRPDAEAAVKK